MLLRRLGAAIHREGVRYFARFVWGACGHGDHIARVCRLAGCCVWGCALSCRLPSRTQIAPELRGYKCDVQDGGVHAERYLVEGDECAPEEQIGTPEQRFDR